VFLVLVEACKPESYTLCSGGCVVSYSVSPRSLKLLEKFLSYAEAVREILPALGIGMAAGSVAASFRWFGLKPDFTIDPQAEERALAGVQGAQTYRNDFERLRIP